MAGVTFFKYCEVCKKETRHTQKSQKCMRCARILSNQKAIETCLKHYGCENPSQSREVKEKKAQTCLERYGVEISSQSELAKESYKKTCLERYGVVSTNQLESVKEKSRKRILEKYGVENYFQTEEFKQKSHTTCLKKYGVENYTQTKEFAQKRKTQYQYDCIHFDSSWELAYYIWLKDQNTSFEYQCDPIEYFYDGKKCVYIPDFKIGDQYLEIKGPHFFTEEGKFVNPFDRSEEADSHNQSKYDCMLENNVKIITDVTQQLKYVKELGVDLNQYRKN